MPQRVSQQYRALAFCDARCRGFSAIGTLAFKPDLALLPINADFEVAQKRQAKKTHGQLAIDIDGDIHIGYFNFAILHRLYDDTIPTPQSMDQDLTGIGSRAARPLRLRRRSQE